MYWLFLPRTYVAGLSDWFCPSVCLSTQKSGYLVIYRVESLLNPTVTLKSKKRSICVYLIVTKAVYILRISSSFLFNTVSFTFFFSQQLEYGKGWASVCVINRHAHSFNAYIYIYIYEHVLQSQLLHQARQVQSPRVPFVKCCGWFLLPINIVPNLQVGLHYLVGYGTEDVRCHTV